MHDEVSSVVQHCTNDDQPGRFEVYPAAGNINHCPVDSNDASSLDGGFLAEQSCFEATELTETLNDAPDAF